MDPIMGKKLIYFEGEMSVCNNLIRHPPHYMEEDSNLPVRVFCCGRGIFPYYDTLEIRGDGLRVYCFGYKLEDFWSVSTYYRFNDKKVEYLFPTYKGLGWVHVSGEQNSKPILGEVIQPEDPDKFFKEKGWVPLWL